MKHLLYSLPLNLYISIISYVLPPVHVVDLWGLMTWLSRNWWPYLLSWRPYPQGSIYCHAYCCLLMFIDVFPECLIEDIEAPSYVGHMPILPQFQCIVIPRTTPSWLYDVWPCWFLKSTPFLLVKSSQILIFHKIDLNGLPSGNLLHSCWKWQFIVDLPIENGDFP